MMPNPEKLLYVDNYRFLVRQVRATLICLTVLVAVIFLGRPDGAIMSRWALWALIITICIGATVGFVANLASIVVLLTGGDVSRKTLHVLTTIFSVILAVFASLLFSLLVGKPHNPGITLLIIGIAEAVANITTSFE